MGLVNSKVVEHLERNRLIRDYQAVFTGGRRLEENLFIVRYCIEETFRLGKRLIVVAIDFEKAFDSVALIRALMNYKCDPRLIDEVLDLCVGDRTEVWQNGILVGDTEVTGDIIQGCTGSPQLFVMVVSIIIINSIVEIRMGYRDDNFYVPVLFCADDGLLLVRSCGEAEDMIQMVIEIAGECGLNINKGKKHVLLFNHDGIRLEEVGGIRVSNTIRYLGADMGDRRMCFAEYRNGKIQLAESMANLTFSVISRSCDKLLIGKTYWKSVVQPRVLSAATVVVWTKKEKKQLLENRVWGRYWEHQFTHRWQHCGGR